MDAATGKPFFYHFDRLGSTLFLTDGGEVTDGYVYDPYGTLLGHMGDSDQPFTFIGRYGVRWEPAGNLYDMRARCYDPATARFLTRDPIWPVLSDPQSLNPYQYAAQNPLVCIDLTGECSQQGPPVPLWSWDPFLDSLLNQNPYQYAVQDSLVDPMGGHGQQSPPPLSWDPHQLKEMAEEKIQQLETQKTDILLRSVTKVPPRFIRAMIDRSRVVNAKLEPRTVWIQGDPDWSNPYNRRVVESGAVASLSQLYSFEERVERIEDEIRRNREWTGGKPPTPVLPFLWDKIVVAAAERLGQGTPAVEPHSTKPPGTYTGASGQTYTVHSTGRVLYD